MDCLILHWYSSHRRGSACEAVSYGRERAADIRRRTATTEPSLMNTPPRPDGEGYAVEVSLLKFRPLTLALAAACPPGRAAPRGGGGAGAVRKPPAPRPQKTPAPTQDGRNAPAAIPNSATS